MWCVYTQHMQCHASTASLTLLWRVWRVLRGNEAPSEHSRRACKSCIMCEKVSGQVRETAMFGEAEWSHTHSDLSNATGSRPLRLRPITTTAMPPLSLTARCESDIAARHAHLVKRATARR